MPRSVRDITAWGSHDYPTGAALLQEPLFNKGTAYTHSERAALGIQGLLPPRIFTIEDQLKRVRGNLARKSDPLEK